MSFERLYGGIGEKSIEYFQKVYRLFSDRTVQTLSYLPSPAPFPSQNCARITQSWVGSAHESGQRSARLVRHPIAISEKACEVVISVFCSLIIILRFRSQISWIGFYRAQLFISLLLWFYAPIQLGFTPDLSPFKSDKSAVNGKRVMRKCIKVLFRLIRSPYLFQLNRKIYERISCLCRISKDTQLG